MKLFYKGRHRGTYVEKPEWKKKKGLLDLVKDGTLTFNGTVTIPAGTPGPTVTITPSGTLPALLPGVGPTGTVLNGMIRSTRYEDAMPKTPKVMRVWKDGEFMGYAYE